MTKKKTSPVKAVAPAAPAEQPKEPTVDELKQEILNLRQAVETLKRVIIKNQIESLAR